MSKTIQVGMDVWLFDANNRHYVEGKSGPVYRKHFVPTRIIGETRDSWLLENVRQGVGLKINKKTRELRPPSSHGYFGLSPTVYFDIDEVEDATWAHDHVYEISRAVSKASPQTLRAIKALLDKEEK